MSLPFPTDDFDALYSSIANVLKVEFPQQPNETIQEWHRRLLFELMKYIQEQFEPKDMNDVVDPGKGSNNKKKDNAPANPLALVSPFESNLEKALGIVSQDSTFSIYLFSWFAPFLLLPSDWFEIKITIDNSATPAAKVCLQELTIRLEDGLDCIRVVSLNEIDMSSIQLHQFRKLSSDVFVNSIFKAICKLKYDNPTVSHGLLQRAATARYDDHHLALDSQTWSFKLATFFYELEKVIKPMFVSSITFESNLTSRMQLNRSKANPRKRFNARKYLNYNALSDDEVRAQVLQTLIIAAFRTLYDYDPDTIDPDLFNYLFLGQPLGL